MGVKRIRESDLTFRLLVLLIFLTLLGGCGSTGQPGSAPSPTIGDGSTPGLAGQTASPTGPFPIAAPSQVLVKLRGTKQVSSLLTRDASDYVSGFSQRVIPTAPSAIFSPAWADGHSAFDTVSYAIYRFDLTARTGKLGIHTLWTQGMADKTRLWIGASNWTKDRWDWSNGAPAGVVDTGTQGMGLYKHPDTSEMYVAVVVLGQGAAKLSKVWLTCSLRGDWWMYGRDTIHSSTSPFIGPDSPTLLWQIQLGQSGEYAGSPVYDANGTIYVSSSSNDFIVDLYALSPDGTQLWTRPLDNPYIVGSSSYSAWGPSPVIGDDGTIYFSVPHGSIYAFQPDGTEMWNYGGHETVYPHPAIGPDGTIVSLGGVSATNDYYLHAINVNGTLSWEHYFGANQMATGIAIGSDGTIFASSDNNVFAFDPAGAIKWAYDTALPVDQLSIPAVDADGRIYVTSLEPRLLVLNPDGALDASWPLPDRARQLHDSVVIGADGAVYVSCEDGWLYVYNADGTLRWSFNAAGPCRPVLDKAGNAYLASSDARLYALDPDGALKWWFVASCSFLATPAIGEDGTIYCQDANGMFYAIGPGSQLEEYTASGYVKDAGGNGLAGVEVTISGEEPVLTDATGYWSKNGLADGLYLVSPSLDGWRFSPAYDVLTTSGSDTNMADFTGEALNPAIWPMYGLDRAHTRRSPHFGPANPDVLWSVKLDGDFRTEPTIGGDGALYMQSYSGTLFALNPDGSERWRQSVTHISDATPLIGGDGTVYTTTSYAWDPRLYAFTPGGVYKWSVRHFNVYGAPILAADGSIICGGESATSAFNPDGTPIWSAQPTRWGEAPTIAGDGTIYYGYAGDHLAALNSDGSIRWNISPGALGLGGHSTTAAVGADATVYLGIGQHFYAYNPDGTQRWDYQASVVDYDSVSDAPAISSDGTIYFVKGLITDLPTN